MKTAVNKRMKGLWKLRNIAYVSTSALLFCIFSFHLFCTRPWLVSVFTRNQSTSCGNLLLEMNDKYIAGAVSGIIEVLCTHPLDFIKTKQQEYAQKELVVSGREFYSQISKGNFLNFYTGLIPRVLGVAPMRLIFWGVQGSMKEYLDKHNIASKWNFLAVGTAGGMAQTVVDNPIELIKISHMTGTRISLKALVAYKGLEPALYRNVGFATVISYACFNVPRSDSNLHTFLTSAVAGLVGSVLTQPFDYCKTLKQRKEPTILNGNDLKKMNSWSIFLEVYKAHPGDVITGLRTLYAGVLWRSSLSFCTMGIGFVTYANILEKLEARRKGQE